MAKIKFAAFTMHGVMIMIGHLIVIVMGHGTIVYCVSYTYFY
jgi:hypothetical protein